jgi:hypothetical protein
MRGLKILWGKSAATRVHGHVVTAEWVSRKKLLFRGKNKNVVYNPPEFDEKKSLQQ